MHPLSRPNLAATWMLALALAAVAACDKKPSNATPPAPPPPDGSACKLVTKTDAAHLLGRPVGDGAIGAKPGPAECHYKADGPPGAVDVVLFADGEDGLRKSLKSAVLGADPLQMPGVGTRAYRNADSTAFGLLAKGKFVLVSASATTGAEAFAAELATRM